MSHQQLISISLITLLNGLCNQLSFHHPEGEEEPILIQCSTNDGEIEEEIVDEVSRQHFEYIADGLKEGEVGPSLKIQPRVTFSPWKCRWKQWRRWGGKAVVVIAFPLLSWWLQKKLVELWESKVSKSLYKDVWGKEKGIKVHKSGG